MDVLVVKDCVCHIRPENEKAALATSDEELVRIFADDLSLMKYRLHDLVRKERKYKILCEVFFMVDTSVHECAFALVRRPKYLYPPLIHFH